MQLFLPNVSGKTRSKFTKVIFSPRQTSSKLEHSAEDKVMNEPRENGRRDKTASEPSAALMRRVLLTGRRKFADVYQSSDEDTASSSSSSSTDA